MENNCFSPQKQADLLEIISYVLHLKNYPEDTIGSMDKKIKLLRLAEQQAVSPPDSNIQLSKQKGIKVNFLRVVNTLFELGFFTDKKGNDITKKEVFKTLGIAINQDFSTFHSDLAVTKATANSDMRNTLSIFEQMHTKQQEINLK